ncbi:hypothetical protein FA15DRAFT_162834 [Coprinopsis marcescibilis]|uniref:Uncharacterized protein n=1 Tax=Coprinopsis marcescibilis TaxID=230819 RepID=A0A5C3KUZ8_COPMA|nr:hypothetical protein FA15DRAFT_162834 [Coprinopsis marcescibilis]
MSLTTDCTESASFALQCWPHLWRKLPIAVEDTGVKTMLTRFIEHNFQLELNHHHHRMQFFSKFSSLLEPFIAQPLVRNVERYKDYGGIKQCISHLRAAYDRQLAIRLSKLSEEDGRFLGRFVNYIIALSQPSNKVLVDEWDKTLPGSKVDGLTSFLKESGLGYLIWNPNNMRPVRMSCGHTHEDWTCAVSCGHPPPLWFLFSEEFLIFMGDPSRKQSPDRWGIQSHDIVRVLELSINELLALPKSRPSLNKNKILEDHYLLSLIQAVLVFLPIVNKRKARQLLYYLVRLDDRWTPPGYDVNPELSLIAWAMLYKIDACIFRCVLDGKISVVLVLLEYFRNYWKKTTIIDANTILGSIDRLYDDFKADPVAFLNQRSIPITEPWPTDVPPEHAPS